MAREYVLHIGGKSYRVTIESQHNEEARVLVDGRPFIVQLRSTDQPPRPQPTAALAAAAPAEPRKPAAVSDKALRAPMPGVIRQILIKVGDTVKAGQALVVMEAMKMENELVAPVDGRVSAIAVSVGASLNTGDLIIVLE
jgi:biotin carboxyl carrier protein